MAAPAVTGTNRDFSTMELTPTVVFGENFNYTQAATGLQATYGGPLDRFEECFTTAAIKTARTATPPTAEPPMDWTTARIYVNIGARIRDMIINDIILPNAIKTDDDGAGSRRAMIAAKLGSAVMHICIRDGGPVPRKIRMNAGRIENAFVRAATAGTLGSIYIEVQTTNLYFHTLEPEKINFADWEDDSIQFEMINSQELLVHQVLP